MTWYTLFVLAVGFVLAWMWSRLELADLDAEHAVEVEGLKSAHRVEVDELVERAAFAAVRAEVAESSARWHARLSSRLGEELDRVSGELELERVVSEAYAAAIERQEL